jgi:hypothetical protein
MLDVLAWVMLFLGGFICVLNFYTSFLRYPFLRFLGHSKESFQWVSGAPFLGSLLVAISLLAFHSTTWILVTGIILILIDTGGIHWFAGTMLYHAYAARRNKRS